MTFTTMANLKQRRLSREERRTILDRVREWQLAEPALREPATQTELARELGVHQSYVSRILSHTPATVFDSVIEGDQEALIMHRRIVRSIAEDAAKGDPKARELYLKYISQPYRVPKKKESQRMPEVVRRAMEMMPTAQIRKEREEQRRLAALQAREKRETENNCDVCGSTPCKCTASIQLLSESERRRKDVLPDDVG